MSEAGSPKKQVRVWADGCFDMMHFGHANALRQAKACGDYLVVGVHSDAEIQRHKGCPPVMNEEERYAAVEACKWVDEVARDVPYVTDLKDLEKYNIDFCVHGEDISVDSEGRDSYEAIKKAGKFRVIKRTDGVSTTDIVGRMLLMSPDHLRHPEGDITQSKGDDLRSMAQGSERSPYTGVTSFLATSRKIVQFSSGKAPKPEDKVVYIDGAFDLFHVGHSDFLGAAKKHGDFLVVGIHEDDVVHAEKGSNYPIMTLHERVLSVLSCRYVDEVVIGAPFAITKDLIDTFNVKVVIHGTVCDPKPLATGDADPYKVPKELGIYLEIPSPRPSLKAEDIVERIIQNRRLFEERNRKKEAKEVKIAQAYGKQQVEEI